MSKIIPKVTKEDGSVITNQMNILKETKDFYQKLYEKKMEVKIKLCII